MRKKSVYEKIEKKGGIGGEKKRDGKAEGKTKG